MKIFRAIYTILNVVILTLFWGTTAIFCSVISPGGNLSLKCARLWSKNLFFMAGIKVKVIGAEKWEKDGLYLFMSNHKSSLDINALFVAIDIPLRMVSKKEYLYVPVLGLAMWLAGLPFIDRGNREKAIKSLQKVGRDIREKRRNILIYPEGTRSRDGSFQQFKKGPFHMALEVKIPIVPVVVMESDKLLKPDTFTAYPGTIYVYFGDPIPTDGYSNDKDGLEKLSQRVREAMQHLMDVHMETVEPER